MEAVGRCVCWLARRIVSPIPRRPSPVTHLARHSSPTTQSAVHRVLRAPSCQPRLGDPLSSGATHAPISRSSLWAQPTTEQPAALRPVAHPSLHSHGKERRASLFTLLLLPKPLHRRCQPIPRLSSCRLPPYPPSPQRRNGRVLRRPIKCVTPVVGYTVTVVFQSLCREQATYKRLSALCPLPPASCPPLSLSLSSSPCPSRRLPARP